MVGKVATVTIHDPLEGWIPLFLSTREGKRTVDWAYMGQERFIEPFCFETLQKLTSRPFNCLFRQQSDLQLLQARRNSHPGLPLKGIVFHMSRCGSTLAAQWLAGLPDSVVLSEPEPLETLLQWPDSEVGTETIQGLLSALGQPRRDNDRGLYLKTDCWHMIHIDRLLAAFPGTPWIFLYRNPIEVLESHRKIPGWHLVPGSMAKHGLTMPREVSINPIGHGAWVLSHVLRGAIEAIQRHSHGLLLNYSELPEALESKLLPHFGIAASSLDFDSIKAITGRHAKRPSESFVPEIAAKSIASDPEIEELAARWLDPFFQKLEHLRKFAP